MTPSSETLDQLSEADDTTPPDITVPAIPIGTTSIATAQVVSLATAAGLSAGPVVTLADALAMARARGVMTEASLAASTSAVKVLMRVTGKDAADLPAAPEELTPIIAEAFPARYRISRKRWLNAISGIRSVLRDCGLHAPASKGLPSNPAWAALIGVIGRAQHCYVMAAFGRWCSDVHIEPEEVTEETLEAYGNFRRTHTITINLAGVTSACRIVWNSAARARLPGWPARLLTPPRRPHVDALPLESFPATFQDELALYLAQHVQPDAFDAVTEYWRPATVKVVRRHLIRAASVVAKQRGGTEHVTALADIVTVDAVEHVLRHVYERCGRVWHEHARNIANYLLLVARHFVKADEPTVARLEELRSVIIKRLSQQRTPGLTERVTARLMPFDDPRLLRRFFRLPADLYLIAAKLLEEQPGRRAKRQPVRAARTHEQALMLDVLQHDPMRRYNLAGINFKEDFIRDPKGRIVRLWISGDRTKNGVCIDSPIPPDLAKRIKTHLDVYRPHLRGAASPWLFPSPQGAPRALDNVTRTLGRIARKALGVTFTPHMMRHIVATQLYRQDPHNGVVVQRKLRHSSIKITERAYGQMSNASANAAWQRELDRYRRAHAKKPLGVSRLR